MRAHAIDLPIFKYMVQLLLRRIEVVAASNPERYISIFVSRKEMALISRPTFKSTINKI